MANLSAPFDVLQKRGEEIRLACAAVKNYRGGAAAIVLATGYATPLVPATTDMKFVGVYLEGVDNSAGAAGAKYARIARKGVFEFNQAGLTVADIGKGAYFTDDNTISLTRGAVFAGIIVAVNVADSKVEVDIEPAVAQFVDFAAAPYGLILPSAAPTTPAEGSAYFKPADQKIYVYYNGGWIKTAALT